MTAKKISLSAKVFLFLSSVFCGLIFSCASTPSADSPVGKMVSGTYDVDPEEKTAITRDGGEEKKTRNYTYFSTIAPGIMADVEVGTPSSLRKAAQTIRKTADVEFTENEKVLLAVETSIMQMVWNIERVDWESPAVEGSNSYLGAISSAKNGIYDMSTGNVDFLTILLPSLVVVKVNDVSGFFSESEASLKKCLSLRQDSVLATYLLGVLYKKNGMIEKAVLQFRSAVTMAPEIFQTSYAYAEALFLSGNIKSAETQASALLARYSSNTILLKLCAKIFYAEKDYSKAEEYVSRVLQQEPNDLQSVLFRARILIDKKDYIHAASLLDVYSRQDSSSKDYLLLRSQVQYDWSKNSTAAVATIETALKNYPGDKEVMLYAAKISGATGLSVLGKSAEEYANSVLSEEPDNETALFYATEGFIRKKDWVKAYSSSSRLVSKGSSNPAYNFNHIKICLAQNKYDEAWNLASSLYRANQNDEETVQCYIQVMVSSGRNQQALSLINQLLSGAASKFKSFLYYQRSYLQSAEEASLSDLRSSLISNPRNSDALYRLYEIYYSKLDYRKAQYYLKQVVALNPNNQELKTLNEKLNSLIN